MGRTLGTSCKCYPCAERNSCLRQLDDKTPWPGRSHHQRCSSMRPMQLVGPASHRNCLTTLGSIAASSFRAPIARAPVPPLWKMGTRNQKGLFTLLLIRSPPAFRLSDPEQEQNGWKGCQLMEIERVIFLLTASNLLKHDRNNTSQCIEKLLSTDAINVG